MPIGAAHYVRNTGSEVLHQIAGFPDESPKTFDLSNTLSLVPHDLLAQNVKLPIQSLPALQQQPDLGMIPIGKVSLPQASTSSPFTANIHNITPKTFEGGFTVPVTSQDISALDSIGFLYLQGKPGALREPHWHPNAAELTYIIQGSAQEGIIASDKIHKTFAVQSGDVSFVPTNWLHYLNITSNDPLIMLSFFSNSSPTRIDFSQMMEVFSHPLLAASLGSNLQIFQKVPELSGDLFLVSKSIVG